MSVKSKSSYAAECYLSLILCAACTAATVLICLLS